MRIITNLFKAIYAFLVLSGPDKKISLMGRTNKKNM